MMKDIFYFENNGKHLFSAVNLAEEGGNKTAVLFCHPYAEEKQRADRVLVRLAGQLEKIGITSMRVDCSGYGDSEGEFEEANFETQKSDIIAAMDLLREQYTVDHIYLFGLRFGAVLAALVAEANPDVDGLVLWSPVLTGKTYLEALYRNKIFSSFSDGADKYNIDRIKEELIEKGKIDIDGYYLTADMAHEIEEVEIKGKLLKYEGKMFVGYNSKYDADTVALVSNHGDGNKAANFYDVKDKVYWDMKTHYEWYYPEELLQKTVDWARREIGVNHGI